MIDWHKIRTHKFTPESPGIWPQGVRSISLEGVSLLGIHEKTGKLYWDGDELVTNRTVELKLFERVLASIATATAVGGFVLQLGKIMAWWN